jgi:hypothetical protein
METRTRDGEGAWVCGDVRKEPTYKPRIRANACGGAVECHAGLGRGADGGEVVEAGAVEVVVAADIYLDYVSLGIVDV